MQGKELVEISEVESMYSDQDNKNIRMRQVVPFHLIYGQRMAEMNF